MWLFEYAAALLLMLNALTDLRDAKKYLAGWRKVIDEYIREGYNAENFPTDWVREVGWEEIREGKDWAVRHIVAAVVKGFLAVALFFGW